MTATQPSRVTEPTDSRPTSAAAPHQDRSDSPPGASAAAPVVVDGLTRQYDDGPPALDHVSVTIDSGRTLCVLGPSGCGKSTLLKLVAGLEIPDAGRIVVGSDELSRPGRAVPPERRGINMVFQDYALWPHLTVRQIIGYGLRVGVNRTSAAARTARVEELVSLLRLDGLEDRRPAEISGGQQQRVAIARALATSPKLLLFDEPLSNLDTQLRAAMREELAMLLRSLRTTALYVTHDVTEALALADQILVLHEGKAVQLATPAEVFTRPRSGWVAALAGFSSVLELERVESRSDDRAIGIVTGSDAVLVGRDCGRDAFDPSPTAKAYLHPDTLSLDGPGEIVRTTVVTSVFEGRAHRTRVSVGAAGTVVLATPDWCRPGEPLDVRVDPGGVLLFVGGVA